MCWGWFASGEGFGVSYGTAGENGRVACAGLFGVVYGLGRIGVVGSVVG